MALLKATRTAQWPLVAEFVFSFNDTMADVAGVTKTFGSVFGDAGNFEIIPMPLGAVIVGGEVIVETQGAGPTAYSINVGINGDASALASGVDLKAAAGTRTALTLTKPLLSNAGQNIRMAVTSTVANATAGKARVRVMYTMDTKSDVVATT